MKIFYDHQAFTIQDYGGISRYFFELTRQYESSTDIKVYGSLQFSNNEFIRGNKIFQSTSFFRGIGNCQKKTEFMNLFNELKSGVAFKRGNFDLFHPTYYDPYYLTTKSKKPIVITFHDLIHEKFMQSNIRMLANKKSVLNRADKIITVSQSSKNDLMEYYKIPEARITTIHLASSIGNTKAPTREESTDDYLLYVGNRNHYKNFIFFTKAIAPLLLKHNNLFLYCAGGGKFSPEECTVLRELKIESKVKLHSGTDENLTKIYSNALAFIFPSLYEGFGLPLVEAMSCGCPIGASQTSSLPEVAGDAALYFNPYDKDSILSVAETLLSRSDIRSSLKQKGFLRAQEFSWKKTSNLTQGVYASLL